MITCVIVVTFIWALAVAKGAGALIHTSPAVQGSMLSWNMVYGLSSFLGAYGSGFLGQSDWTRYAKTPNAAIFGQAITAPLTICITTLMGILITSAAADIYGTFLWNPFVLFLTVQQSGTPASRAGTFFAGLGLLAIQFMLCILNSVGAGMDLTTLWPRFINLKRGSYFILILGIVVCPWNFVNAPGTFVMLVLLT